MKKILTSIFALGLVLSLGACGKKPATSSSGSQADENDTVLEDKESNSWALHGNFLLADGTENGWNGKDNELYEKSKMTAISINQAKAIKAELGTALANKKVKHLYKYEGAILGTNNKGFWGDSFFMKDNDLYRADGSYCLKGVKLSYDAEEEVYSEEQWIPHDHDCHMESLTPSTLFVSPTFAEEPDANGFSWNYNPVAIGAGVYTVIIAEYDAAPSADVCNYGMGLVLTQDKTEEAQPTEKLVQWVAGDHTYGVIGDFAGSGWATDVPMNKEGNAWVATVTLAAGNQFKVRADNDWTDSWGPDKVDTKASTNNIELGDNIIAKVAGSYTVKISFTGSYSINAKIVVTFAA